MVPPSVPNFWYVCHVASSPDAVAVSGGTVPGIPAVLCGCSSQMGWFVRCSRSHRPTTGDANAALELFDLGWRSPAAVESSLLHLSGIELTITRPRSDQPVPPDADLAAKIGPPSLDQPQSAVLSAPNAVLLPYLLEALNDPLVDFATDELAWLARYVSNWNGNLAENSVAPHFYSCILRSLANRILAGLPNTPQLLKWSETYPFAWEMICYSLWENRNSVWLPDSLGRKFLLLDALREALPQVANLSKDLSVGSAERAVWSKESAISKMPRMARSTFRQLVYQGETMRTAFAYGPGQSERRASDHYNDLRGVGGNQWQWIELNTVAQAPVRSWLQLRPDRSS